MIPPIPEFLDRRGKCTSKPVIFSPEVIEARDTARALKTMRRSWERYRRKQARIRKQRKMEKLRRG